MRFLDDLRAKGRGVLIAATPAPGVDPADESTVRERLRAIAGWYIETVERDGRVVVAWTTRARPHGELYRAIEVELDTRRHVAKGRCVGGEWEPDRQVGVATIGGLVWCGSHQPDEPDRFSWDALRGPVIDAVTGAGWTYRPKWL